MGLMQDLIRKARGKKEEKQDYERHRHIEENYSEKKMNSNERELLEWREKERQIMIKRELEDFRKRENEEVWSGKKGNPLYAKNVVAGQKNLFDGSNNLFSKKTEVFN